MSQIGFHHGTGLTSANHLLQHGLDAAAAARYNGSGEFWATKTPATADWFARTNPAWGLPARFDFEIPDAVLQFLLSQQPPAVFIHSGDDYEFRPSSFELLNQQMSSRHVVSVK
jgi:hypothetical protein